MLLGVWPILISLCDFFKIIYMDSLMNRHIIGWRRFFKIGLEVNLIHLKICWMLKVKTHKWELWSGSRSSQVTKFFLLRQKSYFKYKYIIYMKVRGIIPTCNWAENGECTIRQEIGKLLQYHQLYDPRFFPYFGCLSASPIEISNSRESI